MSIPHSIIAAILLGFLCVSAASGQKAAPRAVVDEAERISKDTFGFIVKTKKGATVYGVSRPTDAMLNAIDKGLGDLFAVAKKNRLRKKLKYSDYTIFVAKADRQKDYLGNYSPDLAVAAKQYAGSEYDKGAFIYAAGIVVAFQPMAFMIGEHEKDLERVAIVVRYEGEHLGLFHNDRKRYAETADHSKGGSHPILQ
jgi:hypothetical protein